MQPKSSDNSYSSQPTIPAAQGMQCPVCSEFIPISIYQLLHEGSITCPHCELTMTINKTQSQKALEALKKVEEATKRVRDTEKFTR